MSVQREDLVFGYTGVQTWIAYGVLRQSKIGSYGWEANLKGYIFPTSFDLFEFWIKEILPFEVTAPKSGRVSKSELEGSTFWAISFASFWLFGSKFVYMWRIIWNIYLPSFVIFEFALWKLLKVLCTEFLKLGFGDRILFWPISLDRFRIYGWNLVWLYTTISQYYVQILSKIGRFD